MPTGTRSSISTNRLTNPMMATASVLIELMRRSLDRLDLVGLLAISSGWKISR